MSIVKTASAHYKPLGKKGLGKVSTQSGALSEQPYGFNTRFEDKPGTNPEELIGSAHASCFAMALSFALGAVALCCTLLQQSIAGKCVSFRQGDCLQV